MAEEVEVKLGCNFISAKANSTSLASYCIVSYLCFYTTANPHHQTKLAKLQQQESWGGESEEEGRGQQSGTFLSEVRLSCFR